MSWYINNFQGSLNTPTTLETYVFNVCVLINLEHSRRAYNSVLPASLRPVNNILFPIDLLRCHMANNTEMKNRHKKDSNV
ncbi:hypothetical protein WN48_06096 [Eufriesea mexicana]|nr:hypothetical protein WN48_06096 [Eufriesea mexicana]